MYRYFISICLFFIFIVGFSQEKKAVTKDSIAYKSAYGLRVGIDISKPIKSLIDGSYSGFEIVGDYRISKRFYIATELGYEEETTQEDYTNSTSKGNYIRLGFNFNAYENWLDMNNEITLGYRYGFSFFDQTLHSYAPNVNTLYFPSDLIIASETATNLNAHWSEFVVGIKVETFKNFYISASVSYKILMAIKNPNNFKTLFAPGFNRVFDSNTGFGFNYTISYTIPFVNK